MSETAFEAAMERVSESLEKGDIQGAISALQKVVSLDPASTLAHFQLGTLLFSQGQHEQALEQFELAISLSPDLPEPVQNLGLTFEELGRNEEAVQAFRKACDLAPDWPDPWLSAGCLLARIGDNKEAIDPLNRAMALAPDDWRPPFFLGNALLLTADPDASLEMLQRSTGLPGASAEAYNNLGRTLEILGRAEEALTAYRRARQMDPDHFRSAINLGNLLTAQSAFDEAEAVLRKSIELRPDAAEGHTGLGNLLHIQHRHDEAIETMLRATDIQDDDPELINHLAFSLSVTGRYAEASRWYDRLVDLQPDRAAAYVNYAAMFEMMDHSDEALLMLRQAARVEPGYAPTFPLLAHAKLRQCSWENLDSLIARVSDDAHQEIADGRPLSAQPFALLALPMPLDIRLEAARQMSEAARGRVLGPNEKPPWQHVPGIRKPKIRIGYISPDFRSHSVGICFQDLLVAHNRAEFEVYGYHIARKPDDGVTDFYRSNFDTFRDLRDITPVEAAHRIREDDIDILIDLAGHTGNSRYEILALKPAPVQVHFLGYGATTGADYIDYLVTDDAVMPPDAAKWCNEALAYVPHTFMPASRYDEFNIKVNRLDEGLPEDGFVFANFNAHYKFDPEIFAIWMRLLKRIPKSVLWLVSGTERSNQNLKNEASARGIDPDRLVIAKRCGHVAHLARHQLADLGLDNYYHAGGVTTIDALWAGLPVLTLRGPYPNSRTGVGIVEAAGLPELIADDRDHYSRLALTFSSSPEKLAELRRRLIDNRRNVPLFDMAQFAGHLEQAYEEMWATFLTGRKPANIRIEKS
jgi:protein O-GlcNAc transferase